MLNIKSFSEIRVKKPKVYCADFLPILDSSVTMLASQGGVGKSFTAIRLAMEFVLENQDQRAMLWLTEDSVDESVVRYRSIIDEFFAGRDEFFSERIFINTDSPKKFTKLEHGNATPTLDYLNIRKELSKYKMIFLDPLLQFNGCDENSNTHAGVMMGELKGWASEEQKSIVLLHHVTVSEKDGELKIKPRGASEWQNGCRCVYLVGFPYGSVSKTFDYSSKYRVFKMVKDNGIGYRYFTNEEGEKERMLRVFPDRDYVPEEDNMDLVVWSQAGHNDQFNPHGFLKIETEFSEMPEIIKDGCCYSPYTFKNHHRSIENNELNYNLLMVDFDNVDNMKEIQKKYSAYECLTVTTKSHRKMKGGKMQKDCFRMVFRTEEFVTEKDTGILREANKLFMKKVSNDVDESAKDLGRFFFASPPDAEVWMSSGHRRVDFNAIINKVRIEKREKEIRKVSTPAFLYSNSGVKHNELPKETMIETRSGSTTLENLRMTLSEGEKVPCRCIAGIDHGGAGSRHLSAFVKKQDNGNVAYHCSGQRCAHEGTLWCEE
jgi:hypothetical protein